MSTAGSGGSGSGGRGGSSGSGGGDKGKKPATGQGSRGGDGSSRRADPTVPKNFHNPYNSEGVEEKDLPPATQANDMEDTREYYNSTDARGPEDKDRRDKDPGWDSDGYYDNSSYKT
ncbi:hypothetical protein JX266_008419 [Neoarthrinium moseri]|uniref:uncharacterized protein n=1 Tax=Neoarthrinium moseri TaxID=1658444 RepID=UPI001FDE9DCD|nr:uncharacterized protein JN550_013175 [Neoarthrinium moseri]KAI1845561.1 hypothetical protein JX266_008419 [Neoarthrinium moseri]KAI1857542.1 hypothetical protein JN550_013175 [Neoarthrinium moseri]